MTALDPYPPLGVPKPLDRDIWVVDGPVVRMRYVMGSLPFSTRMTIVRLPGGGLWLHSPTAPTEELFRAVAGLGPVRALVAPNRLHWMALAAWQDRHPSAETWGTPELAATAPAEGFRLDRILTDAPAWDGIDQALVPGSFMAEAVFHHRASGTLIVTDLIENFETGHIHSAALRCLMRIGGVMHPKGGTPRDLMLTFLPHRRAARAAVRTIIGWAPRRIVMAHGRIIEHDVPARLHHAFAWTGAAP